jgi:tetratricopeptide (TPR) repeat protein
MTLALLAVLLVQQSDPVQDLTSNNAKIRWAAAVNIGEKGIRAGISPLIDVLRTESNADVISATVDALRKITGEKFGPSYAEWRDWWNTKGKDLYPAQILTEKQAREVLNPIIGEMYGHIAKSKVEIDDAKREIRITVLFTIGVALLFVLIMFYFVANVSSRVKSWKELVNKAEIYVQKSQEITQRTDQILAELDTKKTDVMAFIAKVREDSEGEVERYTDMLQKNFEHDMREGMMQLRQKAEKELEQTLGDLRSQVDVEVRRSAAEQRERIEKQFAEQREKFNAEVQAHTLFLEASFYHIHGKPEEAVRRYRQLLGLKADHVQAWNNLGTVYRELARYDDSLEALAKAIELAPNDATVLYNQAATFARLRKKDRMLEALTRAIANDGEFKDEALNDPAFRDYWNDAQFKDVAEG